MATKNTFKITSAEAFVDTMPVQPTIGGTLHAIVTLESQGPKYYLAKVVPQGINPSILMLEIKVSLLTIYLKGQQTLTYVEHLNTSTQYKTIEIYYQGKKLKTINKIPIIK